jgi:hypothetical protein
MTGAGGAPMVVAGSAGTRSNLGTGGTLGTMGAAGMMKAGAGGAAPVPLVGPDQMLPPTTAYDQPGPFNPTTTTDGMGPGGAFTLIRPASLDQNGFKFVPATWGNGITTTPATYPILLSTVASHGFVIIASDDSNVTVDEMKQGLDWLMMQNDMPGELQGKLDTSRAACLGYSLGGQGSVTCGATYAKAIVTVAMHPASGFPAGMKGPLLLFSGQQDTVCVPAQFVQPVFDQSQVPTFFAMLNDATHFEPVLNGGRELAPMVAWLRLWVFGDQGAKPFFYGASCTLCQSPWVMPQSKMLQ